MTRMGMKMRVKMEMEMVVRMRDEAGGGEMRCELRGQRAGLPSWEWAAWKPWLNDRK
jgi:hypothetical protein